MTSTPTTTASNTKVKPKVGFWLQIQSLLNTINHVFILLIGVYVTLLARSLNFQDTAMHMFMTVIGVSKPAKSEIMYLFCYTSLFAVGE